MLIKHIPKAELEVDKDNKSDSGLVHSVLDEMMSTLSELFFPLSVLNTESLFEVIADLHLGATGFEQL